MHPSKNNTLNALLANVIFSWIPLHVTAIFTSQELDGVVYQTCPMPADPSYSLYNADAFLTGDTLPNSGHIRGTVSPTGIKIDYIRAFLPADETAGHVNGEIAFSYLAAD